MNTYAALDSFLGRREHRNVPSIRSTMVIRRRDGIAVQYHNTDVVVAHQDGTFTLNTGGFRTSTTKARINDFSPTCVYQKAFVWYVKGQTWDVPAVPFKDGMRVNYEGLVCA